MSAVSVDPEQAQRAALIGHLLAAHSATGDYKFPATRVLKVHHEAAHGATLHGARQAAPAGHRHNGREPWT